LLRFESPYVAVNPSARDAYASHEHNGLARAQHWRHEDGPRPTLCVIHGFGASPAWFNSWFFSLREFFREGWEVLLYTLPFHGGRAPARLRDPERAGRLAARPGPELVPDERALAVRRDGLAAAHRGRAAGVGGPFAAQLRAGRPAPAADGDRRPRRPARTAGA